MMSIKKTVVPVIKKKDLWYLFIFFAQLTGAVEYSDCISAEG